MKMKNQEVFTIETSSAQEGKKEEIGLLWPHHQAQHTPTFIIRRENRRNAQSGLSNNDVDGEYNRVVRIWLHVEATRKARQELLAATHCTRPSNGWNPTTKTHPMPNNTVMGAMPPTHG